MDLFTYLIIGATVLVVAGAFYGVFRIVRRASTAHSVWATYYGLLNRDEGKNPAEWRELKETILESQHKLSAATFADLLSKVAYQHGYVGRSQEYAEAILDLAESNQLDFKTLHGLLIRIKSLMAYGSKDVRERMVTEYTRLLGMELRSILLKGLLEEALKLRRDVESVDGFGDSGFRAAVRLYTHAEWNKAVVSVLNPDANHLILDGFSDESYEEIVDEAEKGHWASSQVLQLLIEYYYEPLAGYLSRKEVARLSSKASGSMEGPVC